LNSLSKTKDFELLEEDTFYDDNIVYWNHSYFAVGKENFHILSEKTLKWNLYGHATIPSHHVNSAKQAHFDRSSSFTQKQIELDFQFFRSDLYQEKN
jgi:hypothetical protein